MFGSKGTIEIQLSKNNFQRGEAIQGRVILQLKKSVKAKELTIRLIANEKRRQNLGTKTSAQFIKAHDSKFILDNEKEYPPNQPLIYNFSIKIPAKVSIGQVVPGKAGEILGAIEKVQAMSRLGSTTNWYLIANLTVSGMFNDIKKKIQINVLEN